MIVLIETLFQYPTFLIAPLAVLLHLIVFSLDKCRWCVRSKLDKWVSRMDKGQKKHKEIPKPEEPVEPLNPQPPVISTTRVLELPKKQINILQQQ